MFFCIGPPRALHVHWSYQSTFSIVVCFGRETGKKYDTSKSRKDPFLLFLETRFFIPLQINPWNTVLVSPRYYPSPHRRTLSQALRPHSHPRSSNADPHHFIIEIECHATAENLFARRNREGRFHRRISNETHRRDQGWIRGFRKGRILCRTYTDPWCAAVSVLGGRWLRGSDMCEII